VSDNQQPVIGDAPPKANTLLSNRAYDRLKFVAQILLPGLGTLYFSLAGIWGANVFPAADQVSGTVLAIDTFLGLFLVASNRNYKSNDNRFDGQVSIRDNEEEGTSEVGFSVDPDALTTKDEVTLKVKDISRGIVEH
jgi:hypothetical protein